VTFCTFWNAKQKKKIIIIINNQSVIVWMRLCKTIYIGSWRKSLVNLWSVRFWNRRGHAHDEKYLIVTLAIRFDFERLYARASVHSCIHIGAPTWVAGRAVPPPVIQL
jgi:hypothetical protein